MPITVDGRLITEAAQLRVVEDGFIGISRTQERLEFDGSSNIVKLVGADLEVQGQKSVIFGDSANTKFVTIKSPSTVTSDYTLTLPVAVGTSGQVLTTDNSGNLSWTNSQSTGSGDSPTFTNLVLTGNLEVRGVTTQLNTATAIVEDETLALGIPGGMVEASCVTYGTAATITSTGHSITNGQSVYIDADADGVTGVATGVYVTTYIGVNSFSIPTTATAASSRAIYHSISNTTDAKADGSGFVIPGTTELKSITYSSTGDKFVTGESVEASSFIKTSGTASQFLKADGTVDSNVYITGVLEADVTQHQAALSISESQISDLQSYLTSETSHADVLVDGDFSSAGLMKTNGSGTYSVGTDNSSNWDTAHGWGDHSSAGYLTSETNNLSSVTGTLAIANGGTGATTVAGVRTNIDLDTADNVQFARLGLGVATTTKLFHVDTGEGELTFHNDADGSNANLRIWRNDTSIASGNPIGYLSFAGSDASAAPTDHATIYADAAANHATGDNPTNLKFQTTDSGSETLADRMTIRHDGNVGIGTSTPTDKLEVHGTNGELFSVADTFTGAIFSANDISGLPVIEAFDSGNVILGEYAGNVGIGTASPKASLHVKVSTNSWRDSLLLEHDSGDTGWNIHPEDDAKNGLWFGYNSQILNSLANQTASVKMVLEGTTGNVGIDNSSPYKKLHVGSALSSIPPAIDGDADILSRGGIIVGYSKYLSFDESYWNHAYLNYDYSANPNEARFRMYGYYGMNFHTRQGYAMSIRGDSNNIGIGTTEPQQKLEVRGGITAEADSYTKLLIHSDDTLNTTVFTDYSPSSHALTRNNVAHSSTQKKFGSTSIYFDGTDDWIEVADSTDWNFGAPSGNTNDFTIDFWWKDDGSADADGIISIGHDSTYTTNEAILVYKSGSNLELYSSTGTGSGWDVVYGAQIGAYGSDWNHYAIVRSGTSWKCYQNGIQTSVNTNITAEPRNDVNTFYIGRRVWSNTTCAKGYIDEFRVSKGVARWNDYFTPPARPYSIVNDEYFAETEDLATRVRYNRDKGKVFAYDDLTLDKGSSGDMLLSFGSGDSYPTSSTIQFNVKPTGVAAKIEYTSTGLYYLTNTSGGSHRFANYIASASIPSGTRLTIDNSEGDVIVENTTPSVSKSTGSLQVKGGAGIAGDVNVAGGIRGESDSYTKLLIHSDTADNSTTFIDSGSTGHTVTAVSDASHQDVQKKFGGTSIYFDGTDDSLQLPDNADFDVGTGDYTFDCWYYPTVVNTVDGIFEFGDITTASGGMIGFGLFTDLDSYGLRVHHGAGASSNYLDSNETLTANQWYHIAVTRSSGTVKIFVNGVQKASQTMNQSIGQGANAAYIGRAVHSTHYTDGYLDEVRFSNGIARWTSSFTPPARPYSTVNDEFFADIEKGVVVTDNNDDANYDVTFTNGVNGLLEDDGQFYYNPNTGTLRVPNLTVNGTTTTVDTVEMQAENAIVFEGATADAFETTLTITDPTVSDKTITLPDATGTVALTSDIPTSNSGLTNGAGYITASSSDTLTNKTFQGVAIQDLYIASQATWHGKIDTGGTGLTKVGTTLNIDAAQTQITSVGTISTGTWEASTISKFYLATDISSLGTVTACTGLDIQGALTATTKSFDIEHPTKEGKRLIYGSLEGAEHGVYTRGKLDNSDTIELPDHWEGLVDKDTITVQLTAIGGHQDLWVKEVVDNTIKIGASKIPASCFYLVHAERKDVDKLQVEVDA